MNMRRHAGWLAATLGAAGMLLPTGPAASAATAPYRSHAQASAVHVDALSLTDQDVRVANVNAGVATAGVDSTNLTRDAKNDFGNVIVPAAAEGKKSFGEAVLGQVTLLDAPAADPTLDGPLTEALLIARAAAPGAGGEESVLVPETSVEPVVYAEAIAGRAAPAWNAATCVIGEPIAGGEFTAARLEVLETGADEDTPDFDAAVASLEAERFGPKRHAVDARAFSMLYDGKGSGLGLLSAAFAQIVPVTLFEGTAAELTVEVGGPALLRAMADGTPGGAKIEFEPPSLVSITQDGVRTIVLPVEQTQIVELPVEGVLKIQMGQLHRESKAPNGTSASASGSILRVEVLESAVPGLEGVTVGIGNLDVAVSVPSGGIVCPIEVTVDADPETQRTGRTIDVTTTITNRFECPLSDVSLTDTLSTESKALFTITDAPQAKSKTGGTGLSRGAVSWEIGTIAAGKSASRTFTLRVDDGAGKIHIAGDADGTLVNCIVKAGADEASVTGLGKGSAAVTSLPVSVSVPVTKVLGGGVAPGGDLPATGVGSAMLSAFGLLTAAGGLATALRRR